MPNWVLNNVKFGTDKVLKECMTTKNGHIDFDFEKILPMPDVLKDEDESGDKFEKLTQEEKLLFMRDNANCTDWYSWRLRFWGCKWNANDTYQTSDTEVSFQTPWSMPDEIYRAISKKYHTTVEVEYADESIEDNSGKAVYEDGVEVEYEQGDADFRDYLWGYEPEKEEGGDM